MRRAALLALAVVLAGCGGLGPVVGTETRTLTPVSVPDERPDDAASTTATATVTPTPSVVDAIEADPVALVSIHERSVRRAGFAVAVTHAVDAGPTYRLNATAAGDRYRGAVARRDADGRSRFEQGYYNDRQALYVRVAGRNADGSTTVSYRSLPPSFSLPFDATRGDQLRAILDAADLDLVQVTDGGRDGGFYRARAGPTTVDSLPVYPGSVRNATVRNLTLTVSTEGVVTAYDFDYEGSRDGDPVAGQVTVETATVDRRVPRVPEWYGHAIANTTRVAIVGPPAT
jgi:hypothetical protein